MSIKDETLCPECGQDVWSHRRIITLEDRVEELEREKAEALKLLRRFKYTGVDDLKEVPYQYVQELREFLEKHKELEGDDG